MSNGKRLMFYSLFGVLGTWGGVGHSARHWSGVGWDSRAVGRRHWKGNDVKEWMTAFGVSKERWNTLGTGIRSVLVTAHALICLVFFKSWTTVHDLRSEQGQNFYITQPWPLSC